MFFIFFYIESCFILFKLAKEIEKTKIAYLFIENKDIFFSLDFSPDFNVVHQIL